jgi:hypothetical protein
VFVGAGPDVVVVDDERPDLSGGRHRLHFDGNPLVAYRRRMRFLRRALVALGLASAIAGVLRLRGTGGVPPQGGGWRELQGPDLR